MANTTKAISEYDQKEHKLFCIDSVGFANSPMASRGLMRVGNKETVETNYSKKTLKVIGALGIDELYIRFQDKANSENAIALLKEMRKKYGKLFIILDNARCTQVKNYERIY